MPRPPSPGVTADVIIPNRRGEILLIRRKYPPFQDSLALPGGFIECGSETLEECAVREAREETGLAVRLASLLGVRSRPDRDPRGHTVTGIYIAESVGDEEAKAAHAADDASEVVWFAPTPENLAQTSLAFDHADIIHEALARGFLGGSP
jgi:8-oxo-dGTP diphosphatase